MQIAHESLCIFQCYKSAPHFFCQTVLLSSKPYNKTIDNLFCLPFFFKIVVNLCDITFCCQLFRLFFLFPLYLYNLIYEEIMNNVFPFYVSVIYGSIGLFWLLFYVTVNLQAQLVEQKTESV